MKYEFEWYVDSISEEIYDHPIVSNDVCVFHMRELYWWEYLDIQKLCIKKIDRTQKNTVNDIVKRIKMIEFAIIKIHRIYKVDGQVKEDDLTIHDISSSAGEKIADKFYYEKCVLSDNEMMVLSGEVARYKNPDSVKKVSEPYSKIFIELDLMRHFGGYNREDMYSFSKKDLDAIYFLRQCGVPWIPGMRMALEHPVEEPGDLEVDEAVKRQKIIDELVNRKD